MSEARYLDMRHRWVGRWVKYTGTTGYYRQINNWFVQLEWTCRVCGWQP